MNRPRKSLLALRFGIAGEYGTSGTKMHLVVVQGIFAHRKEIARN
jgi:hypothetical protein